ncbi:MAG: hypothetical protein ACTHN3_07775 [Solirubrobacterales bacterium]
MKNLKAKLAAGATVIALGGLGGLALSQGGKAPGKQAAVKPVVHTKVIRRTVHVTKHAKPKHPPAGAGVEPASAGSSSAGAPAVTGSSGAGSSEAAAPVSTGSSSTGGESESAPVSTGASSTGGSTGSAPVSTGASGTGGSEGAPVSTGASGAGGGGGEVEHGDGGGGGDD